jgi:hypothetical protein
MSHKFIPVVLGLLLLSNVAISQDSCIEFENPSVSVCLGDTAYDISDPNPSNGIFSGPFVSADGFFNTVASGAGTFEVSYSVNTAFCVATDTLIFIVLPTDSGLPFTGDLSICEGDSTTLTAPLGAEYYWIPEQKTNSYTYSPDSTTTYLISGVSPLGCTVLQEITIVVNDRNEEAAILGPTTACFGEEVTFEVVGTDDFVWSDGSTEALRTEELTADTTFTVAFGENPECDTTLSISVDVGEEIYFSWSVPLSVCEGELFPLVITSSNAAFFKFAGSTFMDSVEVYIPDDDTIVIEAFDENSCFISQQISLVVNDVPDLQLSYPSTGCVFDNIYIQATGASNYVWTDLETGAVINTFLPNQHIFALYEPDTVSLRVEAISNENCISTMDVVMPVVLRPQISLDTLTAFCENRLAVLRASGATNYEWNNVPGDSVLSFLVSGDTTYVLKGYTVPECPAYDSLFVTMHPNPFIDLLGESSICELDTATLIASGADYYMWNGLDGYSPFDAMPTYDSLIRVIGYNIFGCTDTAEIFIDVDPAPVISFLGDPEICVGDAGLLEVITDGFYFEWSDGSLENTISVEPADDTAYAVTAIGSNYCSRTSVFNVTVHDYPVISYQGNTTVCFGDSLSLAAAGADSYAWSNGLNGEAIVYQPFSTSIIRLYGNSNDCISELPIQITVHERPIVHFEFSADTLCESGTGISWVSSPSGGQLSGDGVVNNWIDLGATQTGLNTVTYTYTNEFNCSSSATDNLIVEQCIGLEELTGIASEFYPNPFADELYLQNSGVFVEATVYSPTGQLMWTGQLHGRMRMDTLDWTPGMYVIELRNDKTSAVKRVVKI